MLETNADFLFKLYLLSGTVHYTIDSLVKIYYYGFTIFTNKCKFWYLIHHIGTILNLRSAWMLDFYPWFMAFGPAYHCVLVAYPKLWFNSYIYAISILSYVFNSLFYKIFR